MLRLLRALSACTRLRCMGLGMTLRKPKRRHTTGECTPGASRGGRWSRLAKPAPDPGRARATRSTIDATRSGFAATRSAILGTRSPVRRRDRVPGRRDRPFGRRDRLGGQIDRSPGRIDHVRARIDEPRGRRGQPRGREISLDGDEMTSAREEITPEPTWAGSLRPRPSSSCSSGLRRRGWRWPGSGPASPACRGRRSDPPRGRSP